MAIFFEKNCEQEFEASAKRLRDGSMGLEDDGEGGTEAGAGGLLHEFVADAFEVEGVVVGAGDVFAPQAQGDVLAAQGQGEAGKEVEGL